MLALGSVGIGVLPILAIVSRSLWHLVLVNFIGGLAVAGVNLLLFNQLLATVPKDRKPPYIAGYNICLGLIGFVAPELGVLLLKMLHMDMAMIVSAVWCIMRGSQTTSEFQPRPRTTSTKIPIDPAINISIDDMSAKKQKKPRHALGGTHRQSGGRPENASRPSGDALNMLRSQFPSLRTGFLPKG